MRWSVECGGWWECSADVWSSVDMCGGVGGNAGVWGVRGLWGVRGVCVEAEVMPSAGARSGKH